MTFPDTPNTESEKAKARVLTPGRLAVIVLLLAVPTVLIAVRGYSWRARAERYRVQQIKDSIARVRELGGTKQWMDGQREQLRIAGEWLTDNFILMRNGDWLVYQNRCSKEDSKAPAPYDVFVGKGSDGKWYCSTWHFCVGMINLEMEGQPESLDVFQMAYYADVFDGSLENCPKDTWRHDIEFEIRGGVGDSSGFQNHLFRAEVTGTTWKRVRVRGYGKVYELDSQQLVQLQGFPPRSYSGSGSEQWYSFVRPAAANGVAAEEEAKIVVHPDSGLTVERR